MVQKEIFALCVYAAWQREWGRKIPLQHCEPKIVILMKSLGQNVYFDGFTQRICNSNPPMRFEEHRIANHIEKLRHWRMQLVLKKSAWLLHLIDETLLSARA